MHGGANAEVDVVGGDFVEVFGLVGAVSAHGAALDSDSDILRCICLFDDLCHMCFTQTQLDRVVVEGGTGGFGVQCAE